MTPFVVAVVASSNRPLELARLLDSLEHQPVGAVVVVENGKPEPRFQDRCRYLVAAENLGCGGGLALAERTALSEFGDRLTHLWILDDDAVIPPGSLEGMLAAMKAQNAAAAYPIVSDAEGRLGWFPGLLDREKFRIIRQARTPAEYLSRCGPEPVPFSWCQGIALLVARQAINELGVHRGDYWVRGEDLEFSLRITARHRGIFVPSVEVRHWPPPGEWGNSEAEFRKRAAMLQNLCYTSIYLPHGRRIARTIPGNFFRFLRAWKFAPSAWLRAGHAFWRGAVRGKPAGL